MSAAIKMEGFQPNSNNGLPPSPQRPVLNRPFSDGSMTVESSILSSLMGSTQSFSFSPGSLPNNQSNNPPFDYNMVSPHSAVIDLPASTSPHSFQPHSMFGHLNFGAENREPPIVAASADNATSHNRSRSQSSSRSSNIGKAPAARSRSGRKLSMNDVRPNIQAPRGRAMQPPRSMSFQTDTKPPASMLAAMGPQRANSINSPDYAFEQQYGIAIPRNDFGRSLWGPGGSAPSVLPDGMASYGASLEGMESPVTPAQNATLLGDESRKQRRRECHNQVEKRRREHINAMIEELNKLLPPKFKMPVEAEVAVEEEEDEDANPAGSPVKKKKTKRAASTSKQQKDSAQCKGRILSDSVQYIRDLQSVNEQQSSRIRYLESLLLAGDQPQPQASSNHSHHLSGDHLEAMQSSPEPERLVPLTQAGWSGLGNSTNNMLVFEASPTEASSGPDVQRSTPLSTGSPETDGKDAVVWGLMDFAEDQRLNDQTMGVQRGRKDSQNELQTSLSQMEIDTSLDGPRSWPAF